MYEFNEILRPNSYLSHSDICNSGNHYISSQNNYVFFCSVPVYRPSTSHAHCNGRGLAQVAHTHPTILCSHLVSYSQCLLANQCFDNVGVRLGLCNM